MGKLRFSQFLLLFVCTSYKLPCCEVILRVSLTLILNGASLNGIFNAKGWTINIPGIWRVPKNTEKYLDVFKFLSNFQSNWVKNSRKLQILWGLKSAIYSRQANVSGPFNFRRGFTKNLNDRKLKLQLLRITVETRYVFPPIEPFKS